MAPQRSNRKGDLGNYRPASSAADIDNIFFTEEGWVYRHFKGDPRNPKSRYWDEIIVAGEAKVEPTNDPILPTLNAKPDRKYLGLGTTRESNGDGYDSDPKKAYATSDIDFEEVKEGGSNSRVIGYTDSVFDIEYKNQFGGGGTPTPPAPTNCVTDADCPAGQICSGGVCVDDPSIPPAPVDTYIGTVTVVQESPEAPMEGETTEYKYVLKNDAGQAPAENPEGILSVDPADAGDVINKNQILWKKAGKATVKIVVSDDEAVDSPQEGTLEADVLVLATGGIELELKRVNVGDGLVSKEETFIVNVNLVDGATNGNWTLQAHTGGGPVELGSGAVGAGVTDHEVKITPATAGSYTVGLFATAENTAGDQITNSSDDIPVEILGASGSIAEFKFDKDPYDVEVGNTVPVRVDWTLEDGATFKSVDIVSSGASSITNDATFANYATYTAEGKITFRAVVSETLTATLIAENTIGQELKAVIVATLNVKQPVKFSHTLSGDTTADAGDTVTVDVSFDVMGIDESSYALDVSTLSGYGTATIVADDFPNGATINVEIPDPNTVRYVTLKTVMTGVDNDGNSLTDTKEHAIEVAVPEPDIVTYYNFPCLAAKQGKDYKDIVRWYYSDPEINSDFNKILYQGDSSDPNWQGGAWDNDLGEPGGESTIDIWYLFGQKGAKPDDYTFEYTPKFTISSREHYGKANPMVMTHAGSFVYDKTVDGPPARGAWDKVYVEKYTLTANPLLCHQTEYLDVYFDASYKNAAGEDEIDLSGQRVLKKPAGEHPTSMSGTVQDFINKTGNTTIDASEEVYKESYYGSPSTYTSEVTKDGEITIDVSEAEALVIDANDFEFKTYTGPNAYDGQWPEWHKHYEFDVKVNVTGTAVLGDPYYVHCHPMPLDGANISSKPGSSGRRIELKIWDPVTSEAVPSIRHDDQNATHEMTLVVGYWGDYRLQFYTDEAIECDDTTINLADGNVNVDISVPKPDVNIVNNEIDVYWHTKYETGTPATFPQEYLRDEFSKHRKFLSQKLYDKNTPWINNFGGSAMLANVEAYAETVDQNVSMRESLLVDGQMWKMQYQQKDKDPDLTPGSNTSRVKIYDVEDGDSFDVVFHNMQGISGHQQNWTSLFNKRIYYVDGAINKEYVNSMNQGAVDDGVAGETHNYKVEMYYNDDFSAVSSKNGFGVDYVKIDNVRFEATAIVEMRETNSGSGYTTEYEEPIIVSSDWSDISEGDLAMVVEMQYEHPTPPAGWEFVRATLKVLPILEITYDDGRVEETCYLEMMNWGLLRYA